MKTTFKQEQIRLQARFKYNLDREIHFPEQIAGVIHFDPTGGYSNRNPKIYHALRNDNLKADLKKCGEFEKDRNTLIDFFHRKMLTEKAYRHACKSLLLEIQNHVWQMNYVARISKLNPNQQYATRKQ